MAFRQAGHGLRAEQIAVTCSECDVEGAAGDVAAVTDQRLDAQQGGVTGEDRPVGGH